MANELFVCLFVCLKVGMVDFISTRPTTIFFLLARLEISRRFLFSGVTMWFQDSWTANQWELDSYGILTLSRQLQALVYISITSWRIISNPTFPLIFSMKFLQLLEIKRVFRVFVLYLPDFGQTIQYKLVYISIWYILTTLDNVLNEYNLSSLPLNFMILMSRLLKFLLGSFIYNNKLISLA